MAVETLPNNEKFNMFEKIRVTVLMAVLFTGYCIDIFFTPVWNRLSDLLKVYGLIFRKPSTTEIWRDDAFFARQRLVGVNPFVIRRVFETVPTNLLDNLEDRQDSLSEVLQNRSGRDDFTLETAINEQRLFIVDYRILDGMMDQFGVCAPIALFLVDANNELMPIAIQLHQSGDTNPVKVVFKSDLGNLFKNLPVSINQHNSLIDSIREARSRLININGIVDKTLSIGRDGMIEIIRRRLEGWRMDTDGILPNDLENRGVTGNGILPGYYYRDDALLVYGAIHRYVQTCVEIHYNDNGGIGQRTVSDDARLQAWILAIISPREQVGGGCGILGLPLDENGETISTCQQLIEILTCIIYICSVKHAVTNFPQYDQYGFQPAYPVGMRGTPPQNPATELTATAIINAIPTKVTCLLEMVVMKLLSTRNTKLLGDFDNVSFSRDVAVTQFQNDLHEVVEIIEERNRIRRYPYKWASPDYIPNSVSI
ncbi:polyunsaturated fatty acid lipoxygenase ALOX8-like [Ylistrum balloti]|uniref:polyunsaturated fatty acid lipoxygenase ALOX8-like n=1 Tax=Ylistrum balloti TaxID=509963 RepID=UPI002905DB41|nr:polyunsaturated fatty acid lipoxygenase ALOX8-like [Ylistrum balloti]